MIWKNSFFLQNSITVSTVFEFLSNNLPLVRFCLVILQNNLADVFQRFSSNANADLNLSFYYYYFVLYISILLTSFSYVFIDCHYFNFLLKRLTSSLDLFIFSILRVECFKTYKDLTKKTKLLFYDREERIFLAALWNKHFADVSLLGTYIQNHINNVEKFKDTSFCLFRIYAIYM